MSLQSNPSRKLRYVIMGAGMSGILAAIRLIEAGRDVVVYEKADRIGGTWRENTYPGLACDVPAHAYTYSFAANPDWTSTFAPGPEIQRYFEQVVARHGVDRVLRCGQEVKSCIWEQGRWHLETVQGLRDVADVVIAATGVLHHPNFPKIPGLERFSGDCFHTAKWDHSVPLDGRRVGVIGSGSTGVQIVCALAGRASHVTHIQRTPQWIMPVPNAPYSDEQRAAFRATPQLIDDIRYGEIYTRMVRRFTEGVANPDSEAMAEIEAIVLKNLEDSVRDPVLREKLRPTYRAACKRLIYSPDYYEKVQRPDVTAAVGRIECVEPEGVRMADGTLHRLDVLALATGFHADRFVRPMIVRGHEGTDLNQFWASTPSAFLGIAMPGFPNFFMLNGPTGPVGNFSLIDIAERQWGYIEQLLPHLESGACKAIHLNDATMVDYDKRRIAAAGKTIFGSGCSSWYLDANGVPATWPWDYEVFISATAKPDMGAFELLGAA